MASYVGDSAACLTEALGALDAARTAVLVIDETGDIDGATDMPDVPAAVARTRELVDAARDAGAVVIFCEDAHLPGIDAELALWGEHGIAGSADAQTCAALKRRACDFVVHKRRYSAFFGTDLQTLLHELNRDTLILCGFDTNICVAHTAADAFYLGYKLFVVADATATFLIGNQKDGLAFMKKCYGAHIANTQDIIDAL